MALTKMTENVENIKNLDTRPNAVNGLSAADLKAEFDKGAVAIKKYLNETLTEELDESLKNAGQGDVTKEYVDTQVTSAKEYTYQQIKACKTYTDERVKAGYIDKTRDFDSQSAYDSVQTYLMSLGEGRWMFNSSWEMQTEDMLEACFVECVEYGGFKFWTVQHFYDDGAMEIQRYSGDTKVYELYGYDSLGSQMPFPVPAPTEDGHAANKRYVDTQVNSVAAGYKEYVNEQVDAVAAGYKEYTNEQVDAAVSSCKEYTDKQVAAVSGGGVTLPEFTAADAGKVLKVKSDGTLYWGTDNDSGVSSGDIGRI